MKSVLSNKASIKLISKFGRNLDLGLHVSIQDKEHLDLNPSLFMFQYEDSDSRVLYQHIKNVHKFRDHM